MTHAGDLLDITRIVRELKVVDPKLRPDEQVLWSQRANRFQSRLRAVGGRLYVTDRRLVFAQHHFDARLGGEDWAAPLAEIVDAQTAGVLKLVHVELRDGSTERFVVRPAGEAAEVVRGAAEAARD